MVTRTITFDGGSQLQQARVTLQSMSGVVAAEVVNGSAAIKVWQGEELGEGAILGALEASGIRGGRITSSFTVY